MFEWPKKKLGFGLMRLPLTDPEDQGSIDLEQMKKMVDIFMSKGFTYFDTAWMYCAFKSEEAVKPALTDRYPRESFTLTTKLNSHFFNSREDMENVFNTQLKKTGAGYFDFYFLHAVDGESIAKYEEFKCFDWMLEKKAAGLVRHIGFSYHDKADVLDKILTDHPEVELVQLQLNYLDWESEWVQARKNYEVCVKHGKPVVVMEGVRGGMLAKLPAEAEALLKAAEPEMSLASWAVRFAASQPNVMVVLSGMSNIAQMEDNTSYMENFRPLTDDEIAKVMKVADIINSKTAIACTGCHYCTDGCPQNIEIPWYFSLYNAVSLQDGRVSPSDIRNYEGIAQKFGRPSDCVECGQCEGICPQHLPIIETLKKVTKTFENGPHK